MKELYDQVSVACSKLVTNRYSTSFSLGIRAFDKKFRIPIYNIYGFVRLADEIVDTFHEFDKQKLLCQFKKDTFSAIEDGISLNPILQAFQATVNHYDIEEKHIIAFLDSMEMDLDNITYDQALLSKYIFGSAEVVGLMCLKVFCENDEALYEKLEPYAISLGSAFQKINFLRDIKDDYYGKGRSYFPDIDINNFTSQVKKRIEEEILGEFDHALIGIKDLPHGVRRGVYVAYKYYISLFFKIKTTSPEEILKKRVRIGDTKKILIFIVSLFKNWSQS